MKSVKSLMAVTVVLVVGLITFSGCDFFGFVGGGEQATPEDTVRAYFEAFQENEFEKTYELTTGDDEIDEGELRMLEDIFREFEITDFEIGDTEMISDTEAKVYVTLTTVLDGEESVSSDQIVLVEEDGRWYIDDEADPGDMRDEDPAMGPDDEFDFDIDDPELEDIFDDADLEGILDDVDLDGMMDDVDDMEDIDEEIEDEYEEDDDEEEDDDDEDEDENDED